MTDKENDPRLPDAKFHRADPEYAQELLKKLSEAGFTERALARKLDVTDRVFRNYKAQGGMPYTVQFALETLLNSTPRTPPSPQELAASRRANNVPDGWIWVWCSNPDCTDYVWIDPAAAEACGGIAFVPVCSNRCALHMLNRITNR